MNLFSLEHSQSAYRADFVLYGTAVVVLAAFVLAAGPGLHRLEALAMVLAGLAGWTAIEYALHRFVLHGVQPFRRWHAAHHERPAALICAPTILSATLILTLVFLPALALSSLWFACALTLGVLGGYLAYALTHHATHHGRASSPWLKRRKHWHALHHHHAGQPGCYGVTSSFWDHVFGSTPGAHSGPVR
jgi:cyclopropane-fatty-acyl-phospholipid synthase